MSTEDVIPPSADAHGYAVFVRKAGNWRQESVAFDTYSDAQAHAKLTRRARPSVEMTRVRRIPHNDTQGDAQPPASKL